MIDASAFRRSGKFMVMLNRCRRKYTWYSWYKWLDRSDPMKGPDKMWEVPGKLDMNGYIIHHGYYWAMYDRKCRKYSSR